MTQSSWFDKLKDAGTQIVTEIGDGVKQLANDAQQPAAGPRTPAPVPTASPAEIRDRLNAAAWSTPLTSVDTVEWATSTITDDRTGLKAVSLRHPADWNSGGSVTWPTDTTIAPTYVAGASAPDSKAVAERFGRIDLTTAATGSAGRPHVAVVGGEQFVRAQVVPRLRGGNAGVLVLSVQPVEPQFYVSQRLERPALFGGWLAKLEYERDGVHWCDELIVLRYELDRADGRGIDYGASVWSLRAPWGYFAAVRPTLRAVALSAATHPDFDEAVQATGVTPLP